MKKLISLLLIAVILLLSVGCKEQEQKESSETPTSQPTEHSETQNNVTIETPDNTEAKKEDDEYIDMINSKLLVPISLLTPSVGDKNVYLSDIQKVAQGMTLAQALDAFGAYDAIGSTEHPFLLVWNIEHESLNAEIGITFEIDDYERFWTDLNSGKFKLPSEEVVYNSRGEAYATDNEINCIKDFYLSAKAISGKVGGLVAQNHSISLFTSNKNPTFSTNSILPVFKKSDSSSISVSEIYKVNDIKAGMTMENVFDFLGYTGEVYLPHPFRLVWHNTDLGVYISIYFEVDDYEEFWRKFNNGEFRLPEEEIEYEEYTGKPFATDNEIKAYKDMYLKSKVVRVEKRRNGQTTVLVDAKQ